MSLSAFRRQARLRRQYLSGVSLLEVLIAVLVLAVGMLGVAALQATALRNNQSALERSQAVVQSYSILDAMRANLDEARSGAYSPLSSMSCASIVPSTAGAPTQAERDVNDWIDALQSALGSTACGQVQCAAAADGVALDCAVTVQWDDSRGGVTGEVRSDAEAEAAMTHTVETVSRL